MSGLWIKQDWLSEPVRWLLKLGLTDAWGLIVLFHFCMFDVFYSKKLKQYPISPYSAFYLSSTCVCVCVCVFSVMFNSLPSPLTVTPPGFTVHGIFQARLLVWVAISYSRRSSRPGDLTATSWCLLQADSLPLRHLGNPTVLMATWNWGLFCFLAGTFSS